MMIGITGKLTPALFHHPYNFTMIQKARRLNQRAKAQKRGVPTAGSECLRFRQFYSGSKPYINPKTQEKKTLRRKLNLSGKSLRRFEKKIERLQCLVQLSPWIENRL